MYLVDTSVWIDYLAESNKPHASFLDALLGNPLAVGICDVIFMELLQGVRDNAAFDRLHDYFAGQRFYRFENPMQSHADAARIYVNCRRKGVTVRSSIDCLVAQCAIDNDVILLHHDRDFVNIGRVVKSLRQKSFLASTQ